LAAAARVWTDADATSTLSAALAGLLGALSGGYLCRLFGGDWMSIFGGNLPAGICANMGGSLLQSPLMGSYWLAGRAGGIR
jgi:hypothetical protein